MNRYFFRIPNKNRLWGIVATLILTGPTALLTIGGHPKYFIFGFLYFLISFYLLKSVILNTVLVKGYLIEQNKLKAIYFLRSEEDLGNIVGASTSENESEDSERLRSFDENEIDEITTIRTDSGREISFSRESIVDYETLKSIIFSNQK